MANFEISYKLTANNEGFYSLDPNDAGGETIYGVARKMHPNLKLWTIVDRFKKQPGFPNNMKGNTEIIQEVKNFYYSVFWIPIRGNEIKAQKSADSLYDSGVNMGVGRAIILAQRALKVPETGKMDDFTLNKLNNA